MKPNEREDCMHPIQLTTVVFLGASIHIAEVAFSRTITVARFCAVITNQSSALNSALVVGVSVVVSVIVFTEMISI